VQVGHHLDDAARIFAASVIRRRTVAIGSDGSARNGSTTAVITAGSMSGPSPCGFTMMVQSRSAATSARSVPVRCAARQARDAAKRLHGVRNPLVIGRPRRRPRRRRRVDTRSIIGRPPMSASAFQEPGRIVAGGDDGDDGGWL
jgi:hypothetical protein